MKLDFDCIVVGAGVAGMSALLYLKRANVNACIIEKSAPGGLINKTSLIENYPGLEKTTGPILANNMYTQLQNIDGKIKYGNVLEIIDKGDLKIVKTDLEELTCKGVILALGRVPRTLNVPGENELISKGISYCAICDGPLYKDKNVVVIGGGNSAIEESLYLSDICKKVTIVHRKDNFTADKYLIEKITKRKNVKTLFNSEAIEFIEKDDRLENVVIKNNKTNKTKKLKCSACFIYIGYVPETAFLKDLKITDESGYILTDENMRTSVSNIYAAGDVIKKEVFQIVTATSDGAIAATSFIRDNAK